MRLVFDIGRLFLLFPSFKSSVKGLNIKDKIFAPMDDDRPCFLSESYISDHFESIDMQIKKIRKKPHFPQNGVLLYGRIDLFLNCRIVSYLGILLSNSPAVKKRGELPATSRTSRQAQSSRIFFRIFM